MFSFSIHSQNTLSTGSKGRFVSYDKLNEFAKYVEFKTYADSLITDSTLELRYNYNLLTVKDQKIDEYENVQIPSLKYQVEILNNQNSNKDKQRRILEEEVKEERKKGIHKGVIGGAIGIIIGFLISR